MRILLLFVFTLMLGLQNTYSQDGYQLTNDVEGVRAIQSKAFNGYYLRLDSKHHHADGPGGTVNVTNYIGTHELLNIIKLDNGRYAIASTFFKNRYLRTDGNIVNLQNRIGSYEEFILHRNDDGSVSFESAAFPGKYLSLKPNPFPANNDWSQGGGRVGLQDWNGSHERFLLFEKA